MADRKKRQGLGRGLSALMADVALQPAAADGNADQPRRPDRRVPIEQIAPNPDQPRRHFAPAALEELAASIREKGIIQPLILRPDPEKPERFQIVAGERRWRAAQMAQLHDVPALVRELDDTEVLEIAIIENIQRADLNPVEEAAGYAQLMERFGHTQEKLAEALGKSRPHVANCLRLLTLPQGVLDMLRDGKLSAGHARALVGRDNAEELARLIATQGLSVREAEKLSRRGQAAPRAPARAAKDADTKALERDLGAALGMRVAIDHQPGGTSGKLVVDYDTLEQLDDLCRRLTADNGA